MNKEEILKFLFAGKAEFTIKSKKTGKHYTFLCKKSQKYKNVFFVTFGKQSVGRIHKNVDSIKFIPVYGQLGARNDAILPFEWFFHNMENEQVEFYHEGRCGKCGRKLTDPESIRRGLGPQCAEEGFNFSGEF
jgi:hypothetical protein